MMEHMGPCDVHEQRMSLLAQIQTQSRSKRALPEIPTWAHVMDEDTQRSAPARA
jgi:hypothetical protein